MTLAHALQQSAHVLAVNGVEDHNTEARMLLSHVTRLSPVQIYTEPDQTLSHEDKAKLMELVARRLGHEPAAYILNHKEFYGLNFYVDHRVLIPRPETETLIDVALEFAHRRSLSLGSPILVADIGTGCGAIAISLALNLPGSKVYATDLSSPALGVARLNCRLHQVKKQVELLLGDLLGPLPGPVDLIVANLPYIKNSVIADLSPEIAQFEPRIALDGGESGLDCIQRLLLQVSPKINTGGRLILEIGQGQEKDISRLIHSILNKADFTFVKDLNGINRAVTIDF